MNRSILHNEGVLFIIKFFCLLALLYYFNLFFISITSRGGNALYIFLRDHLNYIAWLRYSILHTSAVFTRLLGINCYVANEFVIRLSDKVKGLRMVYKCVGYGVMSFWGAFVIANKMQWLQKVCWTIGGWASIWLINCMRMTILLVALENNWPVNKYLDHHTLFNIVSYAFILLLISIYIKVNNTKR